MLVGLVELFMYENLLLINLMFFMKGGMLAILPQNSELRLKNPYLKR